MMVKRFVVMAGGGYGQFTVLGGETLEQPKVLSITWMTGTMGLRNATKFLTRQAAEYAAGQVLALDGPKQVVDIQWDDRR